MEEHNIRFIERTFGELEEGIVPDLKDPYRIMASLGPKMREAVLHNPSGYRVDEVCQILAVDGDIVVGATNPFSGRLMIRGEVVPVQNGSYLFAHEDYRKDNIGGDLFVKANSLQKHRNSYTSGISKMAIGLFSAMKWNVYEYPRLIYLRKSRSVVQSFFHSESRWISPLVWIIDFCLLIHRILIKLAFYIRLRNYRLENVLETPYEVEDIVLSDKHPFMELHDKAWFDWSLNYSISEDERTKRSLFVIRHEGRIEGFIFVKQEFFEQASNRGFKNVYLGSVMEWGLSSVTRLKEKDIAVLSMLCFDRQVDAIQYSSTDRQTIKTLKKYLFVQVGKSNLAYKIKSVKDEAIKDINNWRVRLAASDTVLN